MPDCFTLYTVHGFQDEVLYVGETNELPRRLVEHDDAVAGWVCSASWMDFMHFDTRNEMLVAEAVDIYEQQPPFNLNGKTEVEARLRLKALVPSSPTTVTERRGAALLEQLTPPPEPEPEPEPGPDPHAAIGWAKLQEIARTVTNDQFVLLPSGMYPVVLMGCDAGFSKDGSKKQWVLKPRITAGPCEGQVMSWDHQTLSPDSSVAVAILMRNFAAFGLGEEYFASDPDMDTIARDLTGKKAIAVVGQKRYNGEVRNTVQRYLPTA